MLYIYICIYIYIYICIQMFDFSELNHIVSSGRLDFPERQANGRDSRKEKMTKDVLFFQVDLSEVTC